MEHFPQGYCNTFWGQKAKTGGRPYWGLTCTQSGMKYFEEGQKYSEPRLH